MTAADNQRASERRGWRGLDNPYAFLVPAVVVFGMFALYPIVRSLYLSFFDYSEKLQEVKYNYAESLFNSMQNLEAGRAYEDIAREIVQLFLYGAVARSEV